jgi:hypothetical protein
MVGFSNVYLENIFRYCQDHINFLRESQIRRVTCIVLRHKEFPKYFTYRARNEFREDVIYRHLEPALAFQLELNRLKNYDLDPIPVSNHKMHLYLGKAKVTKNITLNFIDFSKSENF